jgi:cysteine synthase A
MSDIPEIKTLGALGRPGRGRVYNDISETIANTPLVRLSKIAASAGAKAEILLKLEFFNPLSSVKDRIGVAMIDALEASGRLKPTTVLVEPTSGNTGIALAFVAAARGYRLILTMPDSMSIERRRILEHLGAELILTPRELGMKGAIARAEELTSATPDSWMPQQFENPANLEVHRRTTAREILADFADQPLDALITGVGTGGHITACAEVLKKEWPDLKVFAVEPTLSPVLSGGQPSPHPIQGIGAGFVPAIMDLELMDGIIQVTPDDAKDMARRCAREEGLLVGISSGAALAAVAQKLPELGDQPRVLTFNYDTGERYLSVPDFLPEEG